MSRYPEEEQVRLVEIGKLVYIRESPVTFEKHSGVFRNWGSLFGVPLTMNKDYSILVYWRPMYRKPPSTLNPNP